MFTGLIQEKGKILKIERKTNAALLSCQASRALLSDYKVGDSMAVNGVCLTAAAINGNSFTANIMPETYQRTVFSKLQANDEVNLERALCWQQRIEGHLVSGHVDAITRLLDRKERAGALVLTFSLPVQLKSEIIAQGSVALNGVSLTVTEATAQSFSVSLIPATKNCTNLGSLCRGACANIETDMIGKYIKAQFKIATNFIERGLMS